jgi:N-acetylneuraminate synthase
MTRLFEAKPYVVAEVGSNWATREHAIASIGAAKVAGADCVKYQAFTHGDLYGPVGDYGMKMRGEMPLGWLPALREKADACGIDFACTAFSPELVAAVDPFVAWHKVASSDATWPQLLDAVAKTGKPIVLSTGAKSRGDIQFACSTLGPAAARTVLLYCVAAYPASFVDLRVMDLLYDELVDHIDLQNPFASVGLSDHSLGISAAVEAARRGASVIEKHFTAFPELDTPDRPHSLDPGEFRTMVEHIRGVRQPVIGPTPEEKAMLLRHNRRLIATRDVAAGERLTYGNNFGAYRSLKDDTRGFSPFAWQQVEGGIALAPISRGDAIGPGDFA